MNDFITVTRFACDEDGSLIEKTHFTIDILFAELDVKEEDEDEEDEENDDVDVLRDIVEVTTDRLVRGRLQRVAGEDGRIGRRRRLVMDRYMETHTPLTANPHSFAAIIAFRTAEGVDFQRFYANFEYRLAEGGVHVHVSVTYWQQLPASADDARLFDTSHFSQQQVFVVGEDTVRAFAREQQDVELLGTAYPTNPFEIAFQFQRFLLPEMLANSAVDLRGPEIENYFMSESNELRPYGGLHVFETERRFRKRHDSNGLVDV